MMRELFAQPGPFVARAVEQAKRANLTGFNLDWESPGERPNQNKSFYLDTLRFSDTLGRALAKHDILTSFDAMCTADVGPDTGHDVGPGVYGCTSTADAATVRAMHAATGISSWTSMGTYSGFSDPGMALVNEIEWFHANFPRKWGMGLCPFCPTAANIPVQPLDIMLRLSLAKAYGVAEIDVFMYSAVGSEAEQFELYWPLLKALRGCDGSSAAGVPGKCWPMEGRGQSW
jgi:hypothetical protein